MSSENKFDRPRSLKDDTINILPPGRKSAKESFSRKKTMLEKDLPVTEIENKTVPYLNAEEESAMDEYIGESGENTSDFNLNGFLEACGVLHNNGLLYDLSMRSSSEAQGVLEANKDKALAAVRFVLGRLSIRDRYVLQLKDYEYLRNAIYGAIKTKIKGRNEDFQLIILKDMLGRGGMGKVYESDMLKIGEKAKKLGANELVVKEIDEEIAELINAKQCLTNASEIDSPHVMKVYGVEELSGGKLRAYMEKVPGEAMDAQMELDEFLACMEQAAEGAEAINWRGLVHRDLKFENIMYEKKGGKVRAKIIDLDLVCGAEDLKEAVRDRGFAIGTSRFMPPEGFFNLEEFKKKFLSDLKKGVRQSRGVRGDSEFELSRVHDEVWRRFEEIISENENEDEAIKKIDALNVDVDPMKYDVYSLGVMIGNYVEAKRYEAVAGEARKMLSQLAKDMTRSIPSERISISEARERIGEIIKRI